MKQPKDFIRSVQIQPQNRSIGDAPTIGRVAKISSANGTRQRRSHQEFSSLSRGHKESRWAANRWLWGLFFGALILLGGAGWMVLAKNFNAAKGVGYKEPEAIEMSIAKNKRIDSLSGDEAVAFAESALAVRNAADVEKYFRIGENDVNQVVSFLSKMESKEGEIAKIRWRGNNSLGRVEMDEMTVIFKGAEMLKNRVILLLPDKTGNWKIDYDALARTIKPSWDELVEGKVSVGEVRVFASNDNYYNGPFANEQEWQCYGFMSPDTDQIFKGYCKMGSAQAKAMDFLLSDKKIARVTLEIRRVKDGGPQQFEISRVLSSDWAMGHVAFDEEIPNAESF
jgi:hypothetical protein